MLNIGSTYSKKDIYQLLDVPLSQRRGAWDTGYRKYDGAIYIFANIGVAGRTGHDYDNHWNNKKDLVWFAKTKSNIFQPLIQDMIDGGCDVHVFTRTNNADPFTYQGLAFVNAYENVSPAKIVWRFPHEHVIDPIKAWGLFLLNAKEALETEEIYFSPAQGHEYRVTSVSDKSITIQRLSVRKQTEVILTQKIFRIALKRLNDSRGFVAKEGMYKKVAFETAIVWFLPMLDWDDDIKNIVVDETDSSLVNGIGSVSNFKEAENDNKFVTVQRLLRARRGQNKLRENLFYLYDKKCCITGSTIKDILHACHITLHSKSGNNSSTNALLLRSDIHDLFDSNLLGIDPKTLKIKLKKFLKNSEYSHFEGKSLLPRLDDKKPDHFALTERWNVFIKDFCI